VALARSRSVALVGVEGHLVEVEADIATGLPGFTMVGLPDTALQEARDRVRAAVVNSGEAWPGRKITIGLSPATLPKRGSSFDLALAPTILAASGELPPAALADVALLGELGLDGRARPVRGVLPAAAAAARAGIARLVVARGNAAEAALVPELDIVGVRSLRQLLAILRGEEPPEDLPPPAPLDHEEPVADLADVLGQPTARHALEISAAGGHHLYLYGSPGAGKTMLAERLPGLLPRLDHGAALEVTAVHSVAGLLEHGRPLITRPPFCAPHHTASVAALVGGGSGFARPGAVSRAHRGVLFLDEAPEFHGGVLEALRQPLESGEVVIVRSAGAARYPARFQLVLAANPCPCGRSGGKGEACSCTPLAIRRYLGRLSGPLLDRIDLQIFVEPVSRAALLDDRWHVESSAVVAERVAGARERAAARLAGTPWRTNAEVPGGELRRRFRPQPRATALLDQPLQRGQLTARGVDRVLRVAWTLCDLSAVARPGLAEVGMALALRHGGVVSAA